MKDAPKRGKPCEVWAVALCPSDYGAELAERQCCSRTTKKNGGSDEDATRSADQRKQVDGGNTKKVEEAKGEDRMVRCTLLNGSAPSTERKYMRMCDGTQTEEGGNDAARITDERASSEDRKRTSGGVFVALDSNLGAVVGAEEGAIDSGNEVRIAQAWVNVRGVFACFLGVLLALTQKAGPPRNETLLETVVKEAKSHQTPVVGGV